jgi:hypothetical protein
MQPPPTQKRQINYKLGSICAVVTALLLSVQEPLSFLAAKRLSLTQFLFLTQLALVMSIPLLIAHEKSRRDLVLRLGNKAHYGQFAALFLIGMAGLLLFKLGLSNAHPIAASMGRVLYQIALSVTGADNGFVTIFFLLIRALTALISLALSWWIDDLHFSVSWMFYVGLFVVSTSLLFFSLKSWGQPARQ